LNLYTFGILLQSQAAGSARKSASPLDAKFCRCAPNRR